LHVQVKKTSGHVRAPACGQAIGGGLLRSVLKTIRAIVASVAGKLAQPSHSPSREMLAQYFSLGRLGDLLPRMLSQHGGDEAEAVMTATYAMQLADQVLAAQQPAPAKEGREAAGAVTVTVTPQHAELSHLCLSTLLALLLQCSPEQERRAGEVLQFAPMALSVASLLCRLKCEDLLLSLFRAASRAPALFAAGGGQMDWAPAGQARGGGSVVVDASAVLLLLSAALNSSDAGALTALRQRLAAEAELKVVMSALFKHAEAAALSNLRLPAAGAAPHAGLLLEFIQLGAVHATLVFVHQLVPSAGSGGGGSPALAGVCEWALGEATDGVAALLLAPEGDAAAVAFGADAIYAALLPLTDLLACRSAVPQLAASIRAWADRLSALPLGGGCAWAGLWRLHSLCGRLCCLLMHAAAASDDGAAEAEQAWQSCLLFMVRFAYQLDANGAALAALGEGEEAALRARVVHALSAALQHALSRPGVSAGADAALQLLVLAALHALETVSGTRRPVVVECLAGKKKFIDVALGAIQEVSDADASEGKMSHFAAFMARQSPDASLSSVRGEGNVAALVAMLAPGV
jgi:hypothetical protein